MLIFFDTEFTELAIDPRLISIGLVSEDAVTRNSLEFLKQEDAMEELYSRKTYLQEVAEDIERMGATAVSVANRWLLGWPKRVSALLKAGTYLESLDAQVDQEKIVVANEANLRHLCRREILEMYEIRESPPAC